MAAIDYIHQRQGQSGFSIVGLLVGLSLAVIMMIALSLFVGRGFATSREQLAHVLATEEARVQSQRMSDTLRNARNPETGELWLVSTGTHSIEVYTNIDNDPQPEKIRYSNEGSDLIQGVTEEGEAEETRVLSRHLRNLEDGEPLFLYFDVLGNPLVPEEASANNVRHIMIRLAVDIDPLKLPIRELVETVVLVRGVLDPSTLLPVELLPVTLDFPADVNSGIDDVKVTAHDPNTGTPLAEEVIPIATLNNERRVKVYNGGYTANLNYQSIEVDGRVPGWYAWIGPIRVIPFGSPGQDVTEQLTMAEVCLGSDLGTMLLPANCPERQIESGGFTVEYQPIFSYTAPNGAENYIRDITFTYTGN